MKIGLLCADDHANFMYNLWQSLKGQDVVCNKLTLHPFGYANQCPIILTSKIKETYKDCDVVILVHSDWELLDLLDNKLVINYATGTKYRQSPELINSKFKAPITLIALPEFQTAPNYKYLVGGIDTDTLQPTGECSTPIKFGHYPSNKDVKGSLDIVNLMQSLPVTFKYSFDRVSYTEQLQRLRDIDVYIELMASTQGGKPYGSFGITCLEAAALGKIVITQNINDNGLYNETYDIPPINFIKDKDDLKKVVLGLDNYSDSFILGQQMLTRNWVVNNHSYEATGKRLIKILNEL
jgi:hypothetical protein